MSGCARCTQGRDDARCRLPDFGDLDALVARGDVSSSGEDVAPGDRMARGQTIHARSGNPKPKNPKKTLIFRHTLVHSALFSRFHDVLRAATCPPPARAWRPATAWRGGQTITARSAPRLCWRKAGL